MIPKISYLTILDRFSLGCAGVTIFACFQAGMQGTVLTLTTDAALIQMDEMEDQIDDGDAGRTALAQEITEQLVRDRVSRGKWFRTLDVMCVAFNLAMLVLVCGLFIVRARAPKYSAEEEERLNIAKRRSLSPPPTEAKMSTGHLGGSRIGALGHAFARQGDAGKGAPALI